jgi:hypothetical protein
LRRTSAAHVILCRQLGAQIGQQLLPLYLWHQAWLQQQQQQAQQARSWWKSPERRGLAAAVCKGGKKPTPFGKLSSNAPAAAAPGEAGTQENSCSSANGNSSSSSGVDCGWSSGEWDRFPQCPLCQAELQQQQQQQHAQTSSSSSSSAASSDPVPYTDPFMWRRLLWQLLGKLSPEAQAFYAQHLAVCPHCSEQK